MLRAGSQLLPPSVVRENQIGSRNACELRRPSMLARENGPGLVKRSQTAYAKPAFVASAVTDQTRE